MKTVNQLKPNYAIPPTETIAEYCMYQKFGNLVKEFESGIDERNVKFLVAMFPQTPKSFWLNLQKNYDKTIKRLSKKQKHSNDCNSWINKSCNCKVRELSCVHGFMTCADCFENKLLSK